MNFTLLLSTAATKLLEANTRLRVKHTARGGKNYVAIRPSFRCKKTNHMVRVVDHTMEDGSTVKAAHFSEKLLKAAGAPSHEAGEYYLRDVGYGWYLIESIPEQADASELETIQVIAHCPPAGYDDEPAETVKASKVEDAPQEPDDGTPAVSLRTFQFPAMAPAPIESEDAPEDEPAIAHTEHKVEASQETEVTA